MTTQPTVGRIEKQEPRLLGVDLATTAGRSKPLGGDWPAAGVLARPTG